MVDGRSQLAAQEPVYAAGALRAEARRAERQAADPQYESRRSLFEKAAEAYDELAGKFARIAERLFHRPALAAGSAGLILGDRYSAPPDAGSI